MTDKTIMGQLGPCAIPLVSIQDFSKIRMSRADMEHVWQIVGPSATWNLARQSLWMVICAAYLEGLSHGHGLEEERLKRQV